MTQKLTKEIIIPKDKAEFYKKYSQLTGEQSEADGVEYNCVYAEEVTFEETGYKVCVELTIAEGSDHNFVEGNLRDKDGYAIQTCFSEDTDFFGEWFFWTGEPDVEYTVIVKEGV